MATRPHFELGRFFRGSLALTDLDADGRTDAIVVHQLPDEVAVLLGQGDGHFGTPQSVPSGNSSGSLDSILVGDLNNDHHPDVLTVNFNSMSVYLGRSAVPDAGTDADGGPPPLQPPRDFAIGTDFSHAALGDLNADGALDLVLIPNDHTNVVMVMLGNGNGSFDPSRSFAVGSMPGAVAVGDVDGNGKLDVIVVNDLSNDMSVLLGNGDGSLGLAKASSLDQTIGPSTLELADLNDDGRLDAVVANGQGGTLSVSYGNGDGTFQRPWHLSVGDDTESLALADVNGDGKLDIAVTTVNSSTGGHVHVFFGASCAR